jgi:hypothetical protein
MKKFIQLAEGTWALPNSDEQYRTIAELLFGNGPKLNASEMRDAIYSLYGDDELFNMLDDLEDQDPNSDARSYVIDWLKKHDPATFNALYSQGKAQEVSEGMGDKISGWFFKKGSQQIIKAIEQSSVMQVASMTMQMPEKKQKNIIQAAKHYLENVEDHPGLRKFVDIMTMNNDSLVEDAEDGEDSTEQFFVALRDGQDYAVVELEKEGGYWHERLVMGDANNIGGKRYMSYLSTDDIIHWLNRDYDEVSEPFANEWDAEMEMDRMRGDEDDLVDEYDSIPMESISLGAIAEEVLREGSLAVDLPGFPEDGASPEEYRDWYARRGKKRDHLEEPKTNICPHCEGSGVESASGNPFADYDEDETCTVCHGEGEIFEGAKPSFDPASVEKFEEATEMAHEILDANPERNTMNVFRKTAKKAGILDRAEMKQFWIWLDWQGEWTHPSLLEDNVPLADEGEDDEFVDPEAMVDVGDDEDFEDNLDEFDLDELGINIDLEDY